MAKRATVSAEVATSARERRDAFVAIALLTLAVLVAYANSFSVPLLFDDWVTILHNPKLRQLWPIWSALSPPEDTGVGGRPIANLSFVLNYAISGESVRGFHAGNLLIHLGAGLALFGVVRRTLLQPQWNGRFRAVASWLAAVAAGIWMLHPVHTQSVTYVSQRTESLMGLFYFLTLYAFIRAVAAGGGFGRWHIVAIASCFAGMATKEGMVTAPVMVFLYDYAFVTGSVSESWRQRWRLYLALAASWLMLAMLMRGLPGRGVGFGKGLGWWEYLLIECRAVVIYLSLSLWPFPLIFDYGLDFGAPGGREFSCAAGLLLLGGGSLVALWRKPVVGFLGAWFFITLSPTSSVVPIPMQPISENRVYVPIAAVIVALVIGAHRAVGLRAVRVLAAAAVAGVALTAARNGVYRNEISVWSDTVAKVPDSSRAHSNLGHALQSVGRLEEAKREHETALRLKPDYVEAHTNLAAVVGQLGDVDRAIAHCRRALEILGTAQPQDPRIASANYNLGVALTQKGDAAGAIAAYQAALRARATSVEALGNLALLLLQTGKVAEAMTHAQAALQINPNAADPRYVLACGLVMGGRPAEAVGLFQDVLRVQPNHVDAHHNLGVALQGAGRLAEAVASYENCVRLNPNYLNARLNIASALAALGRRDEAMAHLTAALQIDPNSAATREQLEKLRAETR